MFLRATLAVRTRTLGADGQGTMAAEGYLASALTDLGEHAESGALGRFTLGKHRRILGPNTPQMVPQAASVRAWANGILGKTTRATNHKTRAVGPSSQGGSQIRASDAEVHKLGWTRTYGRTC